MQRWNHYEIAFRAFLLERQIPFLAVEERRRTRFEDGSTVKSLDFIVSRAEGPSWLIDVKGRKFPGGKHGGYWKHWSTRDDLVGIRRWEMLFGEGFAGLFVFAYHICGTRSPLPPEQLYDHGGRLYGFIAISLTDYLSDVRVLSPRWQTFTMPIDRFRSLAKPFEDFVSLKQRVQ